MTANSDYYENINTTKLYAVSPKAYWRYLRGETESLDLGPPVVVMTRIHHTVRHIAPVGLGNQSHIETSVFLRPILAPKLGARDFGDGDEELNSSEFKSDSSSSSESESTDEEDILFGGKKAKKQQKKKMAQQKRKRAPKARKPRQAAPRKQGGRRRQRSSSSESSSSEESVQLFPSRSPTPPEGDFHPDDRSNFLRLALEKWNWEPKVDGEDARKLALADAAPPPRPKIPQIPTDFEAALEKAKAQMEKQETALRTKDASKEVSLGTSKTNYIDPRVSIAWAKKYNVPIAKLFNKTLIEKFPWAMSVEEDYVF